MNTNRSRLLATLLLSGGALVVGMILAGGGKLTRAGFSSPSPQRVAAVQGGISGLPSFADLAEAVLPAVVTVRAVTIGNRPTRGNPFEFFFGPRDQPGGGDPREFRGEGAGSGFVVGADGWIVTNQHVIDGATKVEVTFDDKRTMTAEVKGQDPSTDLALLKVTADHELPYLALGDSDSLRVGDWVMAVGNPLLLEQSVTVGIVSGLGRNALDITDLSFENFIQTDAAINRGNSGGPLVNLAGEVVGINTAMNYGAENIGFSVPVNTLAAIVDQLKATGKVRRGYLGVSITNLDRDMAEAFGVASTEGALVQQVQPRSPAQIAGLRNGDVIVAVDARPVSDTRQLIDYVSAKAPGTKVELTFLRNGKTMTTTLTLEERPEAGQVAAAPTEGDEGETEWLGLQYQDLTPGLKEMHDLPRDLAGVWITDVAAASPLVDEGVEAGDVIVEVNGEAVSTVSEFERAMGKVESGRFARLYVMRSNGDEDTQPFFAVVRVP
jgi:serine protease Do